MTRFAIAQGIPDTEKVLMFCPTTGCGEGMRFDSRAGYDARTGLECVYCRRCGHQGKKAREGVRLLFAGQQEYVFSYGPSVSSLKIVLSAVALNLFRAQGLVPVEAAAHAAEWALLGGQVCGTVRLAGDFVLSSCYEYCRRQALKHSSITPL
jgi:hypothetical protein